MVIDLNPWLQEEESAEREKNSCYVLIRCGQPSVDGKIHVEMTYEGDQALAAFLIRSALGKIEN